MLEAARDEQIYAHQAIPTAYAHLSDPQGYPGDHWTEVIARDSRMKWDGFAIYYSDFRSPLERMLTYEEGETLPEEPYTRAQARQVYRFKAALWYRPRLWRRIEIQGRQMLADFDATLRDAFCHDPVDHLGGFWKWVRRGTGKRFRDIDLGDVDPFGEGSGAGRHIAGLGLKPGDQLKYVYDFGDWIEHLITFEEIRAGDRGQVSTDHREKQAAVPGLSAVQSQGAQNESHLDLHRLLLQATARGTALQGLPDGRARGSFCRGNSVLK